VCSRRACAGVGLLQRLDMFPEGYLLDIVDEEWMMDTLPNDDIPLPQGYTVPDDTDEVNPEVQTQAKEKWTDLGLQTMK